MLKGERGHGRKQQREAKKRREEKEKINMEGERCKEY
jgi:hypothetical protein